MFLEWSNVKATNRPSGPSDTMLLVELFTVEPVSPTCSMYLRQLCRFAATIAGAKYIQRKYFHRSKAATPQMTRVQNTTVSANSAQILRRTRLLRTGEGDKKNARRKTKEL